MNKCFTLLKNKKCLKSSAVFDALGDLDELNAALGLARSFGNKKLGQQILTIQNDLIEVGGFLAGMKKIDFKSKATLLQKQIKKMINPSIVSFSRPGQNKVSSFLHLARSLCRRLERRVISLKRRNDQDLVVFLDNLSNLIFWLAKKEEKK